MKTAFKYIFAAAGCVITINAVALFFVSNFNLGIVLNLFLGAAVMAMSLLPRSVMQKLPKCFKVAFAVCICLAVFFASFLIVYGSINTADYGEDAVIVLGAAVHGETPSLTLRKRLDKAVEYHAENPDALVVVSGGRGPQEDITEAEAMQKYLLDNGVSGDKIILEESADSTYTNFEYSKEILDGRLKDDYRVAFITNEYHILRAQLCAEKSGFSDVSYLSSGTKLSYLIAGSSRECLAVVKYLILGK